MTTNALVNATHDDLERWRRMRRAEWIMAAHRQAVAELSLMSHEDRTLVLGKFQTARGYYPDLEECVWSGVADYARKALKHLPSAVGITCPREFASTAITAVRIGRSPTLLEDDEGYTHWVLVFFALAYKSTAERLARSFVEENGNG